MKIYDNFNRCIARSGLCLLLSFFCAVGHAQQSTPPILPDPKMTPGATLPVTVADIAVPGYTKKVRNVPASVKRQVYAEYGIKTHKRGEYEVDHLISLELGGSNSIKNLWPESYETTPWNAHVKDQLENKLHDMVVSGQMSLPDAQKMISGDWTAGYKQIFHTQTPMTASEARRRGVRTEDETEASSAPAVPAPPVVIPPAPIPTPAPVPAATPASPATSPTTSAPVPVGDQVWVNTRSGKYFRPGSRYYGKTKEGKYMTEDAAKAAGYVAAG